jgi:choline dehydrogenase-like flavoprotein
MAHTVTHAPKKGAKHKAQTPKTHPAPVHEYLRGDGLDRESMIAEAAYYRAERRGFDGGDPVSDWLEAEAEIDAILEGRDISIH